MKQRFSGRGANQLRPFNLSYNIIEYAAGSVLFQIGRTKVICTVSLQNGVPPFLKGKKTGWLTAEYSMLPAATHVRKERETIGCKRNGRSVEISRFIGRVLRSVVDLSLLGEKTITIDCDVLQADGGTRSAAICGAYAALSMAVERWITSQTIPSTLLKDSIGAISVGMFEDELLLDLDCAEDNATHADFNFVLTGSGKLIEVQGTAEHAPIAWPVMQEMYQVAQRGVTTILDYINTPRIKHSSDQASGKTPFNPIRFKQSSKNDPA